ncbi:hypothetical protein TI39_contig339g00025 [Zymoseptoria brevis]|uniref:Uncharacterized protein n=1 Tax=Zymoseptoria brevis TaxID=1047168 RepID=A0A0F4GT49_9PEZI|nr:hypothetical protein TI39_contig339g00025 [Zymoseptoria brevis]
MDINISSDLAQDRTRSGAPAAESFIDEGEIVVASGAPLSHATKEVPITPAPVSLHLHDDSITCVCPPGTSRLPKDMVMTINSGKDITWTHLSSGESSLVVDVKRGTHGGDGSSSAGRNPMERFATLLGPNPSPEQCEKVKNLTSTFRCDGPCPGKERTLLDFFLCKKCMAWQHKECQLFGDARDRGGPVCNQCYVDFVVHHDEIDQWQRRQMLRAVHEAVKYLRDPDTMHQTWRRKWCRDLVAGFWAKNKDHFISYLIKRRRQQTQRHPQPQRLVQQQPVQFIQQQPQTAPTNNAPARKRPKRKSTTLLSGIYNEADANSEEDTKGEILLASDDDIIAIPRVKSEPGLKAAKKKKTHPIDSPATAPVQRMGKRRRSPSPPPRNKGPQGPRKSVRMSDRQTTMNPFRDDSSDEEEAQLPTVKTESGRTPPSKKRAPLSAPTIACSCFSSRLATTLDSFECEACGLWQHKRCGKASSIGVYSICNFCLNRSSPPLPKQPPKPAKKPQDRPKPKPEPARTLPSAPPAPRVKLEPALANEVRTLSSTILWAEYLSIPRPDDGEDEVPLRKPSSPPPEWLAEMESRLAVLLTSAGPEYMGIYLNPSLSVFPREPDVVLQALRELATYIVSKGSLRGKRSQLGLLLEVLGMEDKGSRWNGAGL